MKFSRPDADIFTPGGAPAKRTLAQTTHLCVAAHQDDIEIMAYAGIAACNQNAEKKFTGVVVTNGAGSPRRGPYGQFTDAEMQTVRREEQRRAAVTGRYALQIQLAHPSADLKTPAHPDVSSDLSLLFSGCAPEVIYLHSLADKHDTHVALSLRCLEVLRRLPASKRPRRVLGCEVWRDLDWLIDSDKIALDSGSNPELARQLLVTFDSQIAGGKRYDLATLGRRAANATFHTSHQTDQLSGITWALDLTPLVNDPTLDYRSYTLGYVDRLRGDISSRLERMGG